MKIVVIGSGPAGYVAALKAAQLGAEVTVIEDTETGGTCLNRGCIPTKALLASSGMYSRTKDLSKFGIELKGEIVPNMPGIVERKDKIVATQVKGIRALFKSWGVVLKEGRAVLKSASSVEIRLKNGSTETINADRIIIATGSRPAEFPALPFDGEKVLSSTDALFLQAIPASLLIVGAGVIGCEFACLFSDLGTEVTMVEMMDKAVSAEDDEVSELLEKELKKKKIKLLKGVSMARIESGSDGVQAFLSDGKEIVAEKILVSIGRSLNSDTMGLETVGVKTGARGRIEVNNRMETNIPGIYAIGDVTGEMLLAHAASRQGIVAARNIMGVPDTMDYNVVPSAVFTTPEIGSVGLREREAVERGIKIRVGRFHFRSLGKSHAIGEIAGFVKIISDESDGRILGGHIIGPHASDLIHEVAVAMRAGLTASHIAETIHAHPTLAEGVMEAAADVNGDAVHRMK